MTRERLQTMPLEELAALARTNGLEPGEDLAQEDLIELVLEGYEELRQEREEGNNPGMRVEEAKFEAGGLCLVKYREDMLDGDRPEGSVYLPCCAEFAVIGAAPGCLHKEHVPKRRFGGEDQSMCRGLDRIYKR